MASRPVVPVGLVGRARVALARAGTVVPPAAAVAAVLLALLSRGDTLVLAGLLVLVAWRPWAVGAVVPALVAASWRWGSTSLDAMAGNQAVLGPGGWVGPDRAAASAWLAALALVLVAPAVWRRADGGRWSVRPRGRGRWIARRVPWPPPAGQPARTRPLRVGDTAPWSGRARTPNLLAAAAMGATAAVVVAGPAAGGDLWIRVVGTVVAVVLAAAVTAWRGRAPRVVDGMAVAMGVASLVLVAGEAPAWSGTVDGTALGAGVALAGSAALVVAVGARAAGALGHRRV